MRIQRIFAALLVALMLSALGSIAPQPAAAATDNPITMSFTATVYDVHDGLHALGNVQVGDTITGTYTYNANAVNVAPDPRVGTYRHTTAPYGMRVNINGTVVETDPENVSFVVALYNNVTGYDTYLVYSQNNHPISAQYNIITLAFSLYDPTQTAIKNINLPKTAPRLSDYQADPGLQIQGIASDPNSEYEFSLRAHLTKVQKL